jgi:Lrp/AsnC family transcriptional regulator for asnA, asnC and gidA
MSIDERDLQILSILKEDARKPNAAIARTLGVSEATVRRRVASMIGDEVLSVKAVPNTRQLGLQTSALIGVDVEPALGEEVASLLAARSEVVFLGMCAGRYDLFVRVLVADLDALRVFLEDFLTKVPGVRKSETLVLLDTKKEWLGA